MMKIGQIPRMVTQLKQRLSTQKPGYKSFLKRNGIGDISFLPHNEYNQLLDAAVFVTSSHVFLYHCHDSANSSLYFWNSLRGTV